MKKIANLVLAFSLLFTCFASYADDPINEPLYIKEHWFSLTTSYDIETKSRKVGSLYRNPYTYTLSYDFYDPYNYLQATAYSRFFSFNVHFDIFDPMDRFLGAADEQLFVFFPTFDIFGLDGVSKLATAKMNFWGTTFYVYDPVTNKEMAQLYRSFFRLKNDWTFKVTNKKLFASKGINPKVLMTVIAFQGDREYWESHDDEYRLKALKSSANQTKPLLNKVNAAVGELNMDHKSKPSDKELEEAAAMLDKNYQETLQEGSDNDTSNQQQVEDYVNAALDLINSNSLDDRSKKAAIYLLKTRLQSASKE